MKGIELVSSSAFTSSSNKKRITALLGEDRQWSCHVGMICYTPPTTKGDREIFFLSQFHPNLEEEPGEGHGPSTNLSRRRAARRLFRVPLCRKGNTHIQKYPCLLRDSNPGPMPQ
ncbi:hypothetical protein TNCV_1298371 [Trichonephila clavipes]|nr:hypothetical protein TNCV_1298371 [Trichonephila clavipes]